MESSQPFALVAAYGFGKGVFTDYFQSLSPETYKVAYLDLAIFIELTPEKLFAGIINAIFKKQHSSYSSKEMSEDEFYWNLNQAIYSLNGRKLIIALRHAGTLVDIPSEILDRFNNFIYDNNNSITLAITSSTRIIAYPSDAVNSLLGNNYIYLDRPDKNAAQQYISEQGKILKFDFSKYEDDMLSLSHNVHGTIAFLCSIIAKEQPKKLNQHFIFQHVYTHPKLRLFFGICFDSLANNHIEIIRRYCLFGRLSTPDKHSLAFKQLVQFNIFYKAGKSYKFIYDMFSGFIARFLSERYLNSKNTISVSNFRNNYAQLMYEANKSKLFSHEEMTALRLLVDKEGAIVSCEEIGKALWTNDSKYSIYAINKLISRMRVKLSQISNPKSLIVTKYKAGYYLIC